MLFLFYILQMGEIWLGGVGELDIDHKKMEINVLYCDDKWNEVSV